MTPARYYTLALVRALAEGKGADGALDVANKAAPPANFYVTRAVEQLRAGRLEQGFGALRDAGVDSWLLESAVLEPKASPAVLERLDRLPDGRLLPLPAQAMLAYLLVIFLVQASVGAVLSQKVAPVFQRMSADLAMPAFSEAVLHWGLLGCWALGFLAFALLTPPGNGLLLRRAFKSLRSAAAHSAAAGLAAAGAPGAAEKLLARHPELGPTRARDLSAGSLDEVASQLARRAERQAEGVFLTVKVVGTALALVTAVCMAGAVYAFIPLLSMSVRP
ncbi:MAG TPA: hypothetical protein VGK67_23570 [Myxococcales bacterium]|jgi:hypothetical protein